MSKFNFVFGCDEFTVVLFSQEAESFVGEFGVQNLTAELWSDMVNKIIVYFLRSSKIEEIFKTKFVECDYKKFHGYHRSISLQYKPLLSINWNDNPKLYTSGVCVRFSAESWNLYMRDYQEATGDTMSITSFLEIIQNIELYTTRFSRIDFYADLFDYDKDFIDKLNQDIDNNKIVIRDATGKLVLKNKYSQGDKKIGKELHMRSLRFGSRKPEKGEKSKDRSDLEANLYDKKQEAQAANNFSAEKAEKHISWFRLELKFRRNKVHAISNELLSNLPKDDMLKKYIAHRITSELQFINEETKQPIEYTKEMLEIASGAPFGALSTSSHRDSDLCRSIKYLIKISGYNSTRYKAEKVWDDEENVGQRFDDFFIKICQENLVASPKKIKDLDYWLSRHKDETRRIGTFDDFLNEVEKRLYL